MNLQYIQQFKEEGNASALKGYYGEAIHSYSDGLYYLAVMEEDAQADRKKVEESSPAVNEMRASLLGNRAACYLQTRVFSKCIADCDEVLLIDAKRGKALMRRGEAKEALGRFDEALEDLNKAAAVMAGSKAVAEAIERAEERKAGRGPPLPEPVRGRPAEQVTDERLKVAVLDCFERLVDALGQDLAPSRTVERFLGLGSLDHNVAIARRGCVQMAVVRYGVTAAELTDAWMLGGTAFQDLILSFEAISQCVYGQYLALRGGIPGRSASSGPSEPDYEEDLPAVPNRPPGAVALDVFQELSLLQGLPMPNDQATMDELLNMFMAQGLADEEDGEEDEEGPEGDQRETGARKGSDGDDDEEEESAERREEDDGDESPAMED